jgi:hypothetical protein
MIKNVLTHIGGIGLYGVISICLFFAVFVGVLLWAFTLKSGYLNSMRRLPLEDEPGLEPGGITPSRDE